MTGEKTQHVNILQTTTLEEKENKRKRKNRKQKKQFKQNFCYKVCLLFITDGTRILQHSKTIMKGMLLLPNENLTLNAQNQKSFNKWSCQDYTYFSIITLQLGFLSTPANNKQNFAKLSKTDSHTHPSNL